MVYLLNKCFNYYNYDVVFNTNLDDFYDINRFKYQIDCVKDGYMLNSTLMRYITEKNQKVLIVDDDENTRDLLNRILNNEGYMSIDAKNGEDALERVKEKPDLIVLDLDMPKMDGFEFIERTQEDGIKIPIVVFSGKDITAVEEKMLGKFTEGIVKKESKVQTLVSEVNQILKGEDTK